MLPDDDVESTVDEFLGSKPRAAELAELRGALQARLEKMKVTFARSRDPGESSRLEKEIATAQRQIEALVQEELITEFVEDSVRATASWSHLRPEEEEE